MTKIEISMFDLPRKPIGISRHHGQARRSEEYNRDESSVSSAHKLEQAVLSTSNPTGAGKDGNLYGCLISHSGCRRLLVCNSVPEQQSSGSNKRVYTKVVSSTYTRTFLFRMLE